MFLAWRHLSVDKPIFTAQTNITHNLFKQKILVNITVRKIVKYNGKAYIILTLSSLYCLL